MDAKRNSTMAAVAKNRAGAAGETMLVVEGDVRKSKRKGVETMCRLAEVIGLEADHSISLAAEVTGTTLKRVVSTNSQG